MGGYGSGRWSARGTVEDYLSLKIDFLRQEGCLEPGKRGTLNWSRNDEPSGSIGYEYFAGTLRLNFNSRTHGDEWVPVTQMIYFDKTQQHLKAQL